MRKTRTKEKDETIDDQKATNATTYDSQSKGPWVSPEIVKCIEKLNYTVTPLDVSLQTGLPLREVQQQLNAAAILSGGRIEPRFTSPTNPTHLSSRNGKEEASEELEGKVVTSPISPILVYVFDPNLQSKLQKAGWRQNLSLFLKKTRKALFFGLRLSFGIALIASIVIAAIFAILIWIYLQNLNRGGDGGGGRERGRGGGGGFSPFPPGGPGGGPFMGGPRFDLGDLWLFLMWQSHMDRVDRRTRYYYQQPQAYLPYPQQQQYGFRGEGGGAGGAYYPQHPLPIGAPPSLPSPVPSSPSPPPPPPGDEETGAGRRTSGRGREEMGFLEVVFSFLFGEKNTNRSKKKLFRVLASLITSNGGWLIAEQAVPYLDNVLLLPGGEEGAIQEGRGRTSSSSSSSQHEGYMLPIVHHFSGSVASTDDGQLVYLFPLHQLSTSSSSGKEDSGTPSQLLSQLPPSPPLLEEPLIFSRATGQQLMWAFGLGLVNLLEVLGLGLLLFAGDGSLFRVLLEGGQKGGRGVPRGGRGREVEEGQLSVEAIVEFVEPILRPLWWGLLIYAIFFMAVPLFRWLWIKFLENKRILRRNERRMEKCEVVVSNLQSEEVQRKLQLARRVARSHLVAASSSSSSSSSMVPSALLPSVLTIQ